jgi:4,5-dihydroxyphthalate decarboxylase
MADKVKLTIAVANYPHTAAVRDGTIPIEGVEAEIVTVQPQIGAFRRMVRNLEFDVCEVAPTTYIIARAYGVPITALPVFVMRNFHHRGLLVRPDAGIRSPKDLEGRKVGVRAWSVTTGVWTRAVLMEDYGVDFTKVTWVVDDEEHVTQMPLPPYVEHAPADRSLATMMADGELAAGFAANAGIGRSGAPTGGVWKAEAADYPELFPNHEELEADWFRRSGIWPMHGTLVVKDAVFNEHPWVARSLFDAFARAKDEWLARLKAGEITNATDKRYNAVRAIVGDDPLPYGMEANLPTIRALEEAAYKQGLTPRRMTIDELFVDPERA